jgi:hypothetical protein
MRVLLRAAATDPRLAMSCVVSLALLSSGLSILMTGDGGSGLRPIAAGWVGAVVGYWLE